MAYAFQHVLSGTLNLKTATYRAFITSNPNYIYSNIEVAPTNVDFVSNPIPYTFIADTGSYNSTKSVYLSCYDGLFPNITSTYLNKNCYVGLFIDNGSLSANYFLKTIYSSYNVPLLGPTAFILNQGKILSFSDGSNSSITTYRNFRNKIIEGVYGNIQNKTIKIALVDSTYTFNIAHTSYSDISGSVVGVPQQVNNLYITKDQWSGAEGNFYVKTNDPYITFPNLTGNTVTKIIVYIDNGSPATSDLIGIFASNVTRMPYTPTGDTLYLRLLDQIVFIL